MVLAKYNCKQSELYTICTNGWNSCLLYQPQFNLFKTRYTATYIANRIAEVNAAQQLPNLQARNGKSETLRIKLVNQSTICLHNWQFLKRYIVSATAFKGSFKKPALESAGQNHYAKAAEQNWDSVQELLTSASNFIADNLTELTANDNMPPTFQTQLNDEINTFQTLHNQFIDSEETSTEKSQEKIEANNLIYDQLIEMFLDGQEIFINDEATKKRFIFSDVLYLVSGAGTSGIRGTVTDAQTTEALSGVFVNIKPKNRLTTTNPNGKYSLLQVAHGTYNISFQKEGYQPQTLIDFEIKLGTTSKIDIALMPL